MKKFKCDCCGFDTLDTIDDYEVCGYCGWESDSLLRKYPDMNDGPNDYSLNVARERVLNGLAADEHDQLFEDELNEHDLQIVKERQRKREEKNNQASKNCKT